MDNSRQVGTVFPFQLQKAIIFLRGCSIMAVLMFLSLLLCFWDWSVFGTPDNTSAFAEMLSIVAIISHIILFGFSFFAGKEIPKISWIVVAAFVNIATIPVFYGAIDALFSFALNIPVCTGG